ncbi:hypothetical protein GGP91_003302 [Salinibacter ruber]|uniref:hypothetical protein n=1 Tax=Salinibacter ruber TaxID=146919 RepID=UPI002169C068|nr:hypothetical protein [Salinibacter ruber]MCS3831203.1 hypothetical protein [Salinibacter ruber]
MDKKNKWHIIVSISLAAVLLTIAVVLPFDVQQVHKGSLFLLFATSLIYYSIVIINKKTLKKLGVLGWAYAWWLVKILFIFVYFYVLWNIPDAPDFLDEFGGSGDADQFHRMFVDTSRVIANYLQYGYLDDLPLAAVRRPGYAIYGGLIYKYFGTHPVNILIINSVVHAGVVYYGVMISSILFNDEKHYAKWLALVLMAWPMMWHGSVTLLRQNITCFALFGMLYHVLRAIKGNTSGILWSVLYALFFVSLRVQHVILVALLLLVVVWKYGTTKYAFRSMVFASLCVVFIFAFIENMVGFEYLNQLIARQIKNMGRERAGYEGVIYSFIGVNTSSIYSFKNIALLPFFYTLKFVASLLFPFPWIREGSFSYIINRPLYILESFFRIKLLVGIVKYLLLTKKIRKEYYLFFLLLMFFLSSPKAVVRYTIPAYGMLMIISSRLRLSTVLSKSNIVWVVVIVLSSHLLYFTMKVVK